MTQQRTHRSPPRIHLTLHGRARGTHTEPTETHRNLAGTCMAEREEPTRSYESPLGIHRELTPNRI